MNKQHVSNKCFFQCLHTTIISHEDVLFFSRRVELGILLYAEAATISLCAFGKIAAQPWAPVLPSVAWASFE